MKWEHLLTILFAVLIGYLLYLIISPFWVPILWAIVLTIPFYPVYQWLKARLRLESIASLLTCGLVFMVLTIPVGALLVMLASEVGEVYQYIEGYLGGDTPFLDRIKGSPLVSSILGWLGQYIDLSRIDLKDAILKTLKEASGFIAQNVTSIIVNLTTLLVNIVLGFMTMYYLFKDGDKALAIIKELLPLSEEGKESIFKRNKDLITATIYGGVVVSLIQGVLGGCAFWLLGISSPVFWGMVMALLAFLPLGGPALVWIPASIYLIVKGSYIKAVILIIWGALIVSLIDNILRPIIISGRTNLHPILLIFSVFGGLLAFGFIGIIAGPLVLSIALALVEIYRASLKAHSP